MAFDTLHVKAVEGLLSFQIQSTIDRSTDFVWLWCYASATAALIYARNQTDTFRLNGSLIVFNKKGLNRIWYSTRKS